MTWTRCSSQECIFAHAQCSHLVEGDPFAIDFGQCDARNTATSVRSGPTRSPTHAAPKAKPDDLWSYLFAHITLYDFGRVRLPADSAKLLSDKLLKAPLVEDHDSDWFRKTPCPAIRHFGADEASSWERQLVEVINVVSLDQLRELRSRHAEDLIQTRERRGRVDHTRMHCLENRFGRCESDIQSVIDAYGAASWQERSNSLGACAYE